MGNEEEEISFPFEELDELNPTSIKRKRCDRCNRPERVCVCFAFPSIPVQITTTIHIFQHPREQDFRQLTTVPLLQECLPKDRCIVYRGKRFPESKFPEIHRICKEKNTAVLFPSHDAITVEEFVEQLNGEPMQLVVLDGTWREARSINHNCRFLADLPKVKLSGTWRSQFVIKTQPTDESVSTLEAVAIALSQIEKNEEIIQIARKPLKALCDFQIDHGAQIHESKEALARRGIKYRYFEPEKK